MSDSGKGVSNKPSTDKKKTALSLSGTSTPTSFRSDTSRTPLTMDISDLLTQAPHVHTPSEHPGTPHQESEEDNTTYFLLDIQSPLNEEETERDRRSTSSSSSSSSESAQIVIDSGFVRPTFEHHGQSEDGHPVQAVTLDDENRPIDSSIIGSNGQHSSAPEGNRIMTIFTDEEDDLMDEMPRWNQEVMHRRQSLIGNDSNIDMTWSNESPSHRRDRQASYISSTRRDSTFNRNSGLSSEDALK